MEPDRLSTVLAAMADGTAAERGSMIDRVCHAAVRLLSLSGAGLALIVDGELRETAGVSGPRVALVQELELMLGEGPCVEAWRTMEPVLEADLAKPARARWPAFAEAAQRAGAHAVFALPLRLGAIGIGVLVLYRDRAAPLGEEELALGLVLAEVATLSVLGLQAGAPAEGLHRLIADEPAHWAEIHQATGMVSAQLEIPLDEAFVRLRSHAFADGRPLREIANDVIAGRVRLAEDR
jgi:hypothetical protein